MGGGGGALHTRIKLPILFPGFETIYPHLNVDSIWAYEVTTEISTSNLRACLRRGGGP